MFVALAIEGFAEVKRLLPCAELNFHGPAGAVDRGELTHVGLLSAQIGQHEVPTVAEQTFRAGFLAAMDGGSVRTGKLDSTPFSPTRVRLHPICWVS